MSPRKAATAASAHAEGDRRRVDQLGGVIDRNAKTKRQKTQHRDRAPRAIPSPTAPGFLSLYDGQSLLATYVERDGAHFLFDSSGVLVGSFKSRAEAMRAAPMRRRS